MIPATGQPEAKSSMELWPDGTLKSSTMPTNQATANATKYDYVNRLLTKVTPPTVSAPNTPMPAEQFSYYGNGLLRTASNGKGMVTTYTYDKLDRVTKMDFSDALVVDIEMSYDKDGNLKTRTDGTGVTSFNYDHMSRMTSKVLPSSGGTLAYQYDLASNLVRSTEADGSFSLFGYNKANELDEMTEPSGRKDLFGYNNLGARSDTWYNTTVGATYSGNSLVAPTSFAAHMHAEFDNAGNLIEIKTTRAGSDADTNRLSHLRYSYTMPASSGCPEAPAAGTKTDKRQTVTDELTGKVTIYCYDRMGRLTSAATPGDASYTYGWDANTNRIADEAGTHSFNANDQMTDLGSTFDANGNQTASTAFPAIVYNGIDQTTSILPAGQTPVSMTYAGMGQSERTQAGLTTTKNGLLGKQSETTGGQTTTYVRDAAGSLVYEKTPAGDFYYYFDALGSVIGLVNPSGVQRAKYSYDPFGAHATATAVNVTS